MSSMDVGEADRRLVVLTRELGKITVFAYGAKRQKSPFVAAANPFVCGEFTLSEGRGAYRLLAARCDHYFRELTADYEKSCMGFYFLEFTSYFAVENVDSRDYLNLLYKSVEALLNENIPDQLVRYVFELKMFALNGETPDTYGCCVCGKPVTEGFFQLDRKRICHGDCGGSRQIPLGSSTIYTMQYVVSCPIGRLYQFNVSEQVLLELKNVMDGYRRIMIPHSFRSETFL